MASWVPVAALALVATGAAAVAANPAGCAADEEGDGVGLLQSTGTSARVGGHADADPSGGWVPPRATCPFMSTECGTGCCQTMYDCEGNTTCRGSFGRPDKDPTPAKVSCPTFGYRSFGDQGCCPSFDKPLLGPSNTCLENTCENILQYHCGGTTGVSAGDPTCTPGGTLPAETIPSYNGKFQRPGAANETCTLNGKKCYKFVDGSGSTSIVAPHCRSSN